MALSTSFADATVSATNHAAAHNDANDVINDLLGSYRWWTSGGGAIGAAVAAANYILWGGSAALGTSAAGALSAAGTAAAAFRIDPAWWSVTGFSPRLNFQWGCHVGATAPARTLTCGLYPVTTFTNTGVSVVGTVIAGSTAAFASPAANSHTLTASGDFAVPAADWYVMGVNVAGGATAASSSTQFVGQMLLRWV